MRSVVDLWSPYDNLFCVLKTMNSNGFLISREANVTNFTLTNLGPGIYDIKVLGVFVVMVTLFRTLLQIRARNGAGFGENSSSEVVIVLDTMMLEGECIMTVLFYCLYFSYSGKYCTRV